MRFYRGRLLFLFLALVVPVFTTLAAPAFTVGPGKIEVELVPGASLTREITITNDLGRETIFDIEFEDVEASTDGSEVRLLGNKTGNASLKQYLLVDSQTVTVSPGEERVVPITITLPTNAPVGSLHGAIVVKPRPAETVAGPQTVPRLGVLVFVRVAGERQEVGGVEKLATNFIAWQGSSVNFSITFTNTGNTYLNPYGLLTFTSLFGKEIQKPIVPWFVLPGVSRVRTVEHEAVPVGIYRAKLELNRGYGDIVDTDTTWFVVVSKLSIALTLLLVLFIFLSVWKVRIWYNKK